MRRIVLAPFALIAFIVAGCSPTEPPSPSNYIQKVDLESIVRSAAVDGVEVNEDSVSDFIQNREQDKDTTARVQVAVTFRCDPAKIGDFANAVAAAVRTEMSANGVSTDSTRFAEHDWNGRPWTLDYSEADATGIARITVEEVDSAEYPHELKVTIEESTAD